MNRIDERFRRLAERGEAAFIPFVTTGDPNLEMTARIVSALEEAGSDVIELGVPFSDPIADGIVNQEAAQRALTHRISLRDSVSLVKELRGSSEVPLLLFTYFNPVLAYGYEAFARDCASAGVDGVLCVDLPPEEASEYKLHLDTNGIATVFLLAPTSPADRIELIARNSSGFVYYVSRTGVTGERATLEKTVRSMVKQIKQHTDVPVAVGFGISKPEHASEIAGYADGVVIGSAIVRLIGELGDRPETPARVREFVAPLVEATKSAKARIRA